MCVSRLRIINPQEASRLGSQQSEIPGPARGCRGNGFDQPTTKRRRPSAHRMGAAGLPKPTWVKTVIGTLAVSLVIRRIGRLHATDQKRVNRSDSKNDCTQAAFLIKSPGRGLSSGQGRPVARLKKKLQGPERSLGIFFAHRYGAPTTGRLHTPASWTAASRPHYSPARSSC